MPKGGASASGEMNLKQLEKGFHVGLFGCATPARPPGFLLEKKRSDVTTPWHFSRPFALSSWKSFKCKDIMMSQPEALTLAANGSHPDSW